MSAELNKLDKELFIFLNRNHSPFLDRIMFESRNLLLWVPLTLLALFIYYQYTRNKTRPHTLTKTLIFSIFIILQLILCERILPHLIDPLVHRERPFYNSEILQEVSFGSFHFEEKVGFYSSKVCLVMAIAVFFILFKAVPRWLKVSLTLWAIIISYNRIYIGAHYPFNILLSDLLGMGLGLLTYHYYQYLNKSVMII